MPAYRSKSNSATSDILRPLTPREERFKDEYLVDLNGAKAAIRAGFSAKTAKEQACRLLTRPHVIAALNVAREELARRTEITADAVVMEMAKLGFANMADYMRVGSDGDPYLDFSALTRDQAAALQEVTVEDYVDGRGEDARSVKRVRFKLADKRGALNDLGRHLGIFKPDRLELSGPDGGPLEIIDARQRNLDLIDAVARRKTGTADASAAPGGDGEHRRD